MNYMSQFTREDLPWANNQESEIMLIKKRCSNSIRKLIENKDQIKKPSKREVEVYELWKSGLNYNEISELLDILPKTAKDLKYRYQCKLRKNAELLQS